MTPFVNGTAIALEIARRNNARSNREGDNVPLKEYFLATSIRSAMTRILAVPFLSSCPTQVPPAVVAWNERQPIVASSGPSVSGDVGYLRVETDTDLRVIGRETYYNVRRPYDIYTAAGTLLRADIDNQGGRSGEEPTVVPLPPGRYVIASPYGTTYRKVQVEVRPGGRTEVPEKVLREAPKVFPH